MANTETRPASCETLAAILESGLRHVAKIRAANVWEDGVLVVPFVCYGCEESRDDLALMTGDGLPLCIRCLGFQPTSAIVNGIGAGHGKN